MSKNIQDIDKELVLQLKRGDEAALTNIYLKYWEPLFISAFNLLKDTAACEDIIQDVFISIWRKRESIEYSTSLKAYLFASIRYEVFRQIKAGKVRESVFENLTSTLVSSTIQQNLEHKELIDTINITIEQLPVKCREVYKLSRVEHLSHKEIAEKLNISTKTVENHLTKALKILRNSIEKALTLSILTHLIK